MNPLGVLLRHELRRALFDRGRSLRMAIAVAVPVAAAATCALALNDLDPGEEPRSALLRATFEQFAVLAGFAFVLLEIGLLTVAAGMVGLGRRRREVALWFANGARCGAVVAAQSMIAALLGAVGAVCGLAIACGLSLASSIASRAEGRSLPALADLPVLAVIAGMAILASALSGWLPAVFIARLPLRQGLRQNRTHGSETSPRTPVLPALVALVPFAFVLGATLLGRRGILVAAAAFAFAGCCGFLIPTVLAGVAHLSRSWSFAWRMAARDAVRLRERSSPAILAAMVSLAVAIALATLRCSIDAHAALLANAPAKDRGVLDLVLLLCTGAAVATTQVASELCAIESLSDARVLLSIGAEPRAVRSYFAAGAGHLAFVAIVLALPAGVIAALGVISIADAPVALRLPWCEIVLTVLAVPAISWVVRWVRASVGSTRFERVCGG